MVMGSLVQDVEVVVIGGGPGGYVAAIRAADLGKEVMLIEARPQLGGVCLIEGCIPSKTLIHAVELLESAKHADRFGLHFSDLTVDTDQLRAWKESVVDGLTQGIAGLCKRRGIEVITGRARFDKPNQLAIEGADVSGVKFKHCIIATGSRPITLPFAKELPLWTSTEALELSSIPPRLCVVGGGYIGLEMGLVYAGLGSAVTVVEMLPQLLGGFDRELILPVLKSCKSRFAAVHLGTRVEAISARGNGYDVRIGKEGKSETLEVDQVLVAIGRRPNSENLGLEHAGVATDARGFIPVDQQQRTSVPEIYAIGDVTPGSALAHVASRAGKVAAEVIAGHPSAFDNRAIPAVVFTSPELSWTGLTEAEATKLGYEITVGRFPLAALGRARAIGETSGLVKVIGDKETGLLLGVGIVGPHASELIAESVLAIEMGATLTDLEATIHPHPTLSESVLEAVEIALGLPIHTNPPRKAPAPK